MIGSAVPAFAMGKSGIVQMHIASMPPLIRYFPDGWKAYHGQTLVMVRPSGLIWKQLTSVIIPSL